MNRITPIAVLASLALVAPAAAHDKPDHQAKPQKAPNAHKPAAPATSHKCRPHAVAYRVAGTLVSGTLTRNDDGTYSGALVVHVSGANHHARADKGTDKSYTLDHVKVNLHGQDPAALAANSRVKLKGKVTKLAKRCDATGFTSTLTIRRASIKPPKTASATH
jgi:pyruvate/2-oxoglutarate dehydrogenase complex dihydrolipoamide acyltransferase (E2) component